MREFRSAVHFGRRPIERLRSGFLKSSLDVSRSYCYLTDRPALSDTRFVDQLACWSSRDGSLLLIVRRVCRCALGAGEQNRARRPLGVGPRERQARRAIYRRDKIRPKKKIKRKRDKIGKETKRKRARKEDPCARPRPRRPRASGSTSPSNFIKTTVSKMTKIPLTVMSNSTVAELINKTILTAR